MILAHGIAPAADPNPASGGVSVVVENAIDGRGDIRVAIFNSKASFPATALRGQASPASAGGATVTFTNLAPGEYAVSAFQDVNGNGRLDRNSFGMPTEPYGFSRNPRVRTGPPDFDSVKITVGSTSVKTTVHLK
jgi:uncharacterized protein (DUF2141 family)